MQRAISLLVLLVAFLALALNSVDAACRVKTDIAVTEDPKVGAESNGTANKLQAAPSKRLRNKIAFDVTSDAAKRKRLNNKIAFDVTEANSDNHGEADAY